MARGVEFVRGSRAGLRRAMAFGAALAVGLAAGGVIGLLGQVRPRERLPAPSPPPGVLNAGPAPSVAPAEASTLLGFSENVALTVVVVESVPTAEPIPALGFAM